MYNLCNQLCMKLSKLGVRADPCFEDFVHSSQKEKEKNRLIRRNKETMFSILLKKRVVKQPSVYQMSIKDSIAAHAYEMASRNELENSRLLLEDYEQLDGEVQVTPDSNIERVLQLLMNLKDTGPKENRQNLVKIGDGIAEYKNIENLEDFPLGIRSSLKPRRLYKDYPKEVFNFDLESLPQCKLNIYSNTSFIFNEGPKDLDLFNLEPKLGIDTVTSSLYGNTIQEDSRCTVRVDQDEGYDSPDIKEDPTEIWDNIWEVEIPREGELGKA